LKVVSDSGDLVRWCAGLENGRLVMKVANNWTAPSEVAYPRAWKVVDYHGAGTNLQAPYDWLASQAAKSTQSIRILGGGDTMTLAPDPAGPGLRGSVVVNEAIGSWAWDAALEGIDVYFATVGKLLSLSKDDVAQAKQLLATTELATCFTDVYGKDADPTQTVTSSAGLDLAKVTKFALVCGKDTIKDYLTAKHASRIVIGAVGVLAGVVGTAVGLVQSATSGARALVDQVSSLFGSSIGGPGSGYTVRATWAAPASTTQACKDVASVDARDDGASDIKVTGLSCADATPIIRAAAAATESSPRQSSYAVKGYTCAAAIVGGEADIVESYSCRAQARQLTFTVDYGE
jgi:hypothetical protein